MSSNQQRPIIIKRVKKVASAHHGGAWKVAYADFVTAMMAFFLLLWLLNATTDEQKRGISNYFAPNAVSNSTNGSGGVLGGLTLSTDAAAMPGEKGLPQMMLALPPPSADLPDENLDDKLGSGDRRRGPQPDNQRPPEGRQPASEAERAEMAAEFEQQQFEKAAEQLRTALAEDPALAGLQQNLLVDQTSEGLRIQLIDRARVAMFPRGSSVMNDELRDILGKVVQVVDRLPHRLAVAGYTDATPFANRDGYGNWELSADRANASRRMLLELGLPEARIASVVGKADNELLVPEDPFSPHNRRISITLLRETPGQS